MNDFKKIHPRLEVVVSKRARRMALRLDIRARVINIIVPSRTSMKKAYEFAADNKDWIREKLAALPDAVPFAHGEIIPVLGIPRTIHITHKTSQKITEIHLTRDQLLVVTNKEDPSGRILRFLKELAREKITELAHIKAEMTGKKIKAVVIRDTKSRWGSCAPDRTLSFSWRLILAPHSAFDYVIAHEAAHLSHMDHSARFWKKCEEMSQYYKAGKDWMSDNGHSLHRYGVVD